MTTATATIGRTAATRGIGRAARGLGEAIRELGGRSASWSAPYGAGIGDELERLAPSERIDAALRWHYRHGRVL